MRDAELIYKELTEEEKQAFDHCIDCGQMEEAREVLLEYERSKGNESSNEISGK